MKNTNYWFTGYTDYVRREAALGINDVPYKYMSIHVSSSSHRKKELLTHFIQITVL
jgi:hypothetical protein